MTLMPRPISGIVPLVRMEWQNVWAMWIVWIFWRRDTPFADRAAHSQVNVLTVLSHMEWGMKRQTSTNKMRQEFPI